MRAVLLTLILGLLVVSCSAELNDQTRASDSAPSVETNAADGTEATKPEPPCIDEAMRRARADHMCPQHYDPVCGCDDNTYSNTCFSQLAGVTRVTPGACSGDHPQQ